MRAPVSVRVDARACCTVGKRERETFVGKRARFLRKRARICLGSSGRVTHSKLFEWTDSTIAVANRDETEIFDTDFRFSSSLPRKQDLEILRKREQNKLKLTA